MQNQIINYINLLFNAHNLYLGSFISYNYNTIKSFLPRNINNKSKREKKKRKLFFSALSFNYKCWWNYLTALWTQFRILSVSCSPTIRFSTLPSLITIKTGTDDTSKSSAISLNSSMSTYSMWDATKKIPLELRCHRTKLIAGN